MKHFSNNAKEYLKMTDEDFKFRQGRSKRQYENNAKAGFYASVALFFTLLGIILSSLSKFTLTSIVIFEFFSV